MDERKYLANLQARRITLADEGLRNPDSGSEFEYGRHVGLNHGLRIAEQVLLDMLKDDKEENK